MTIKKPNARGVGSSITEVVYNTDDFGNLQIVVIPRPGEEKSIQEEIALLREELTDNNSTNLYIRQLITILAVPNQIYSTSSSGNGSPRLQGLDTAVEISILGRGTRGNIKLGTDPLLSEPYQLRPVGFLHTYTPPIDNEIYFCYIPRNSNSTSPITIELEFLFKAP